MQVPALLFALASASAARVTGVDLSSPSVELALLKEDQRFVVDIPTEETADVRCREDEDCQKGIYKTVLLYVESIPNELNRIAINVHYTNIWEQIQTFPERRPRTFNLMLATAKTWAADFVVQVGDALRKVGNTGVGGNTRAWRLDWRRSTAFAAFGLIYAGIIEWLILVSVFSSLCPHAIRFANEGVAEKLIDKRGQLELILQVILDNFVFTPFMYFPIFYMVKEAIVTACGSNQGRDVVASAVESNMPVTIAADDTCCTKDAKGIASALESGNLTCCSEIASGSDVARTHAPCRSLAPRSSSLGSYALFAQFQRASLLRYKANFWSDNIASCAMWVPGDMVVYAVPMYSRMPANHGLSFLWTMALSYMRG